jgi:GTP-binding protein HflX
MAFNKVDLLDDDHRQVLISELHSRYPDAVFISAQKGINLSSLEEKIFEMIGRELAETEIRIPVENEDAYKLVSRLHEQVEILDTKYLNKSIKLKIRGSRGEIERIQSSLNSGSKNRKEKVT